MTHPMPVATLRRIATATLAAAGLALAATLAGPVAPADAATVSYDLYAGIGSTTLPGAASALPVWGYTTDGSAPTAPGGPVLEATEGDVVSITLHNGIGERTSLLFQGQEMAPDLQGVAAGGTTVYTVHADHAGTYLYEAGLLRSVTGGTEHQVAMGLYGALVVHPATAGRAYAAASTAYDVDQVMLLGEIDPALNNAANKAAFDMRKFSPKFTLINGRAHPDTAPIAAVGGDRVLLRFVNAGMVYHSMGVLGAGQTVVALDGSPLDHALHYTAETIGPGQTADSILVAPALAGGQQLAVYDTSGLLHNNTSGPGGMVTTVDVSNAPATSDTLGPVLSDVLYDGSSLTATADDAGRGDATVTSVEYFMDTVTAVGSGGAMAAQDGTFDASSEAATATVAIGTGQHALYLRAQDANGNWGPLSSVLVTGSDLGGPTTLTPSLAPRITNGDDAVDVSATADDTASGNNPIAAAEYFIDTLGADGAGETMTVNAAAPIASADATIPAGVIGALSEGQHPVFVHSQDAQGNWGEAVSVNLVVDLSGPTTSGVQAGPSPNNGTVPFSATIQAVRVVATTMTDASGVANTTIAKAEAFIDTVGADGAGFPLQASDGLFSDQSEGGYADIPLATIKALSNGTHTLYVHARDEAGNWGPTDSTTILVDKVAPAVTTAAVTPDPSQGAFTVTVSGTATDSATPVAGAEAFLGTDPGQGNGTALTVSGTGPYTFSGAFPVAAQTEGAKTLRVRVKDQAGNWSAPVTLRFTVTAPLYYSTLGNTNPPGAGGTADDADIYQWTGSAHVRSWDASAAAILAGANVDGYDRVDATHFYVSFTPNSTNLPGLPNVQDEDVAFFNGDHWELYFDGSTHNLGPAAGDVDAVSVSGGQLYFSTRGNQRPGTLGGTADDADIYRWNGANSFTRVFDASTQGLPAAANVDGVVWVSNAAQYFSFADNLTLAGAGATQDEDVVRRAGGSWTVYFDGTAHGLGTSNNLDIDAFDLP